MGKVSLMRVLFASSDQYLYNQLETSLQAHQYDVIATSSSEEALSYLRSNDRPLLAILDWTMPGIQTEEICSRLGQKSNGNYIYVILVTSDSSSGNGMKGIEESVDSYLVKPVNLLALDAALRAGQRIIDLQSNLLAAQEALRVQASCDALTGLWDRTWILEVLQSELTRTAQANIPLSVILVDMDRLNQINDAWGHLVGDTVLQQTAQRIQAAVRSHHSVGRYGGDEVLIALPGCDTREAYRLAIVIRRSICNDPIESGEKSIRATISLGVANSQDLRTRDSQVLIQAAEAALSRAKRLGRNRIEFARLPHKRSAEKRIRKLA